MNVPISMSSSRASTADTSGFTRCVGTRTSWRPARIADSIAAASCLRCTSAPRAGLRDQRDVGLARLPRRVALGVERDDAGRRVHARVARGPVALGGDLVDERREPLVARAEADAAAVGARLRAPARPRAGWGRPRAARRRRSASAACRGSRAPRGRRRRPAPPSRRGPRAAARRPCRAAAVAGPRRAGPRTRRGRPRGPERGGFVVIARSAGSTTSSPGNARRPSRSVSEETICASGLGFDALDERHVARAEEAGDGRPQAGERPAAAGVDGARDRRVEVRDVAGLLGRDRQRACRSATSRTRSWAARSAIVDKPRAGLAARRAAEPDALDADARQDLVVVRDAHAGRDRRGGAARRSPRRPRATPAGSVLSLGVRSPASVFSVASRVPA